MSAIFQKKIPQILKNVTIIASSQRFKSEVSPTPTMSRSLYGHKTLALRNMLHSSNLEYIMEAHSGLSARIVSETGFDGIWASGLSISAQLGVRDHNEASWSQVLEVLEYMSDSNDKPILVDADTGYGNFNNARRFVRKLEDRGIAGMCIEDKIFPKTNSLLEGVKQPLADAAEFALKIKACKDAQRDPNFSVVARVEAFIAGYGLEEALKRANMYHKAGADAILMHSKRKDASEIEAFCSKWSNQCPVVIVPTNYYTTPTQEFKNLNVSLIIWANHNLRASISAMQNISKKIYDEQTLINVEKNVVGVKEVFRLQDENSLLDDEKLYLP